MYIGMLYNYKLGCREIKFLIRFQLIKLLASCREISNFRASLFLYIFLIDKCQWLVC